MCVAQVCRGAHEPIDLPSLEGKSRLQLAGIFPGLVNRIEKWRGWKEVYLTFDDNGQLKGLAFLPKKPLSGKKLKQALSESLLIDTSQAQYFRSPAMSGYSFKSGPIRMVNLVVVDSNAKEISVRQIGIFYRAGSRKSE